MAPESRNTNRTPEQHLSRFPLKTANYLTPSTKRHPQSKEHERCFCMVDTDQSSRIRLALLSVGALLLGGAITYYRYKRSPPSISSQREIHSESVKESQVHTTTPMTDVAIRSSNDHRIAEAGEILADQLSKFTKTGDHGQWRNKVVLVMVGLPARGKSYISHKVVAYLRWRGFKADLFNVGKFRRQQATAPQDQSFFDATNSNAKAQREGLAVAVLEQLLQWLEDGGDVAVFDATNTTEERRKTVVKTCKKKNALVNVIFVESICDDPMVLEENYKEKATHSPDYKDMPLEQALVDLKQRVTNYEKVYEHVNNDAMSYIKLINLSSKVICNKIYGGMGHSISSYLMSIHIQGRPIYLVRAGHVSGGDDLRPIDKRFTLMNSQIIDTAPHIPYTIPLDSSLDRQGYIFSKMLAEFMITKCTQYWNEHNELWAYIQDYLQLRPDDGDDGLSLKPEMNKTTRLPLSVYTSTQPRARQTAACLEDYAQWIEQHSSLNMVDMGDLQGLSTEAIKNSFPKILEEWARNRYEYRWPGGESQKDKAKALIPVVMEMERQRFPVLAISHASTLQVIYGYFLGIGVDTSEYYSLNIPQEVVIELTPSQYGWIERRYDFREQVREVLEKEKEEVEGIVINPMGERTLGLHHYNEE
ncbi:6-phosphofructo-2-kinase (predicted) [Planoprotostelium fungivorum]|uniref:6-phosphofructo-2-kinase (Predicted) n=1 Tax=Planoprotostelium fungivorum TaxID=1890364 RepID=A0A2P6NTW2_9EUKA|nr:6-phosphofructo-2-kinase (predicted) [Planoprotostelium fungivorum]